MKQFGKILKFELNYYLKNKVFIGSQASSTNTITETQIQRAIDNGIGYSLFNPTSEPDGFVAFINSAPLAYYANLFSTQALPAYKMLMDSQEI